jgi:hypothetical protein
MSVIRVNFLPEFDFGHDAVVLTMDHAGVDDVIAILKRAEPGRPSVFEHDGVTQEFYIEPDGADIELKKTHIVWRLDRAKADEIIDYLDTLREPRAGHQYVDIVTPAETLVLSCNEYVNAPFPWESPP